MPNQARRWCVLFGYAPHPRARWAGWVRTATAGVPFTYGGGFGGPGPLSNPDILAVLNATVNATTPQPDGQHCLDLVPFMTQQ